MTVRRYHYAPVCVYLSCLSNDRIDESHQGKKEARQKNFYFYLWVALFYTMDNPTRFRRVYTTKMEMQ